MFLKVYFRQAWQDKRLISYFDDKPEGLDIDTNRRDLSVARAKNIYEYLIHKGIDESRLHYRGFGSSRKLVVPEITEEDKTQNRRVEIMVVER